MTFIQVNKLSKTSSCHTARFNNLNKNLTFVLFLCRRSDKCKNKILDSKFVAKFICSKKNVPV